MATLNKPVDEPLVRQAQRYLRTSPYMPLRALSCELDNGVLTVRGRVPSFYHKQLAFAELTRQLYGCEIIDMIEVILPNKSTHPKRSASVVARRPSRWPVGE